MKKPYRISIVDDELLFRKGLISILQENKEFDVLIEAKNGLDFIDKLKESKVLPQLVLLDMEMPIMNGIECTKVLQEKYPEIKIIILSSHYTPSFIINMIELGASSYMKKNEEIEEVILSITNVIETGFHYNSHVMSLIREYILHGKSKNRMFEAKLSLREKEVLKLLCQQYTNKEIAEKLFLSPRTVEGHRNNLLDKTNSKNTAGLVIYAIENGIHNLNMKKKFEI